MKIPKWMERSPNKDFRKESKKQEERIASEIGGRAHSNSGATPFNKGDCSNSYITVECKQTRNASFSITMRDLKKIEKEALNVGKLPIMFIEFMNFKREYVLMRKEDFLSGGEIGG